MKLICGLGNPGSKYDGTRHNAGFDFVDAFARRHDFPEFQEKWKALVSEKSLNGEKVTLMKPLTFMNLSGEAVAKFVNFYKLDKADMVVVYDDVDLPLGTLRYREEGSAGTHNGMKSIIQCLGGQDFPRLRLGVESRGDTAPEQMGLSDFVLAPFLQEEKATFEASIVEGMDLLEKSLALR